MGIFVRSGDQARVVAAIRKYWVAVGAKEWDASEPPLKWGHQGVKMTGKLGYAVWPAACDEEGTEWVAVHDSEGGRGGAELAKVLAEELDVLVVSFGCEDPDADPLKVFRGASEQVRWSGEGSEREEDVFCAIWCMPHGGAGYSDLVRSPGEEGELAKGVSAFGFAELPYRASGYRGPGEEEHRELARQARQCAAQAATEAAIAANDVAALRALYAAETEFPATILSVVGHAARLDEHSSLDHPTLAGRQRMVLAMADELLMPSTADWYAICVAEAAFCAGDRALFLRAVHRAGGYVYYLKRLPHLLMRAQDFEGAIEVLRAMIGHEDAVLTLWRPLAQSVLAARQLPADAAELLARCEAWGMADPQIFHDAARAWLRLGDRERALQSVEAAVKAGYLELDTMRTDERLAALFGEPRFVAAFESGSSAKASEVVIVKAYKGRPSVVQRPVVRFDFFAEGVPAVLGPALAELVEAYLNDVPAGALTSARVPGEWAPLSQEMIAMQLNKLRAAQTVIIDYRGEQDERGMPPTEYGLHIWTSSFYDRDVEGVIPVSVWFPAALAEGDVDAVAARFARYAALMPTAAGGAGLQVMVHEYEEDDEDWLWRQGNLLQSGTERFLSTERHPERDWAKGTAAGAMWLSYLGAPLVAQLGGRDALAAQVEPAVVDEVEGGAVIVRASLRPGLGIGPRPRDLGALPLVARTIQRLTPAVGPTGWDLRPHYQRLCEVPAMGYVNGPPVVADARMREAEEAARAARARGGGVR